MATMHTPNTPMTLILASTSPYRAELLGRLGLRFETQSPGVDESHRENEPPHLRALRLAREKSVALAAQFPEAILIGSDQVAVLDEGLDLFDKPGTAAKAIDTLMSLRGKTVNFYTALHLFQPATNTTFEHTDTTCVDVRQDLTQSAIARYVKADDPLNCVGAFKVESLGIAVF